MRVVFLIDGFNLYHSICDAIEKTGAPQQLKWLNIASLCKSFLHIFNDTAAHVVDIYYFSSIAGFKGPQTVQRHTVYKRAIESTGVKSVMGEFKEKEFRCASLCKQKYRAYVEKQTDVNIALKVFELFHKNECDACVIVSGDGDLLRAITIAKDLFKDKKVAVLFPYDRWNPELSKQAHVKSQLKIEHYKAHLLDDPIETAPGKKTRMPKEWMDSAPLLS